MIPLVSLFVYGPLMVATATLCVVAAAQALARGAASRGVVFVAQMCVVVLWVAAPVVAAVARLDFRDWVHLYWAVQVPLVGIFLGSGALLCGTWAWEDGPAPRGGFAQPPPTRPARGVVIYLGMLLTLGLLPIALQLAIPEDHPSSRDTDRPLGALVEIAAWGLGGPPPEILPPFPRSVTVPFGTTLFAALLWIGFVAILLVGLAIRSQRLRGAFYLLAPLQLALVARAFDLVTPFDTRSGVWRSSSSVIGVYGPVVAAAVALAVLVAAGFLVRRRRRKRRT